MYYDPLGIEFSDVVQEQEDGSFRGLDSAGYFTIPLTQAYTAPLVFDNSKKYPLLADGNYASVIDGSGQYVSGPFAQEIGLRWYIEGKSVNILQVNYTPTKGRWLSTSNPMYAIDVRNAAEWERDQEYVRSTQTLTFLDRSANVATVAVIAYAGGAAVASAVGEEGAASALVSDVGVGTDIGASIPAVEVSTGIEASSGIGSTTLADLLPAGVSEVLPSSAVTTTLGDAVETGLSGLAEKIYQGTGPGGPKPPTVTNNNQRGVLEAATGFSTPMLIASAVLLIAGFFLFARR